ncbi:MAG: hypothetical protein V1798_01895 [Pseudomonadota bacterium]
MKRLMALGLVIGIVASAVPAKAGELEKKSMGVAAILAFDPIPGDALLYAGKPVQGTINLILGGLSGGFFWAGFIGSQMITEQERRDSSSMAGVGRALMMIGGGTIYFPMLLWDAIGGIYGVAQYNKEVDRRRSLGFLETIQPSFAYTSNGTYVGAKFTF